MADDTQTILEKEGDKLRFLKRHLRKLWRDFAGTAITLDNLQDKQAIIRDIAIITSAMIEHRRNASRFFVDPNTGHVWLPGDEDDSEEDPRELPAVETKWDGPTPPGRKW